MILGIDEVGRGPWAGPLVIGAVVLGDAQIEGLTDSKKLSKKKRELISKQIISEAAGFGLGWVSANEIDSLGLSEALKVATRRAVEQITASYHEIIIDGTVNFLTGTSKEQYVTTMKKADLLIASVSAASIVAKVARDDYMTQLDETYPQYNFSSHVGYGTAAHKHALEQFGVMNEHRKSFAPIRQLLNLTGQKARNEIKHSVSSNGAMGEDIAAKWLENNGYRIVDRNWKTRFCEIDIVAQKDQTIYFVEVKHRKQHGQGGGIAAITPTKLRQMTFASAIYRQATNTYTSDARLAVVTTTGDSPQVESYLILD